MRAAGALVAGAVAAIVAAFVSALALAILNLYLTGHQLGSIDGPWIEWERGGAHLSIGDVALLAISITAGIAAGRARWTKER